MGKNTPPEDEQDLTAAHLYTITGKGTEIISRENLLTERYFAKFGYLASLSASHSNKSFKAVQIQDDLLFSSVELAVEVLKKIESIIKDFSTNGGDVDRQTKRRVGRKNIRELEKEAAYERVKKCKDHGGPITDIKDLNKLV